MDNDCLVVYLVVHLLKKNEPTLDRFGGGGAR